jgi:hypothetical protein
MMPILSNKFNGKCICTLVRNSRYFCGMRCLKYCLGLGNIYGFAAADYHSALLLIISAKLLCIFSFIGHSFVLQSKHFLCSRISDA